MHSVLTQAYHFDRDDVALKGFHKYFKKASDEEREHAEKVGSFSNSSPLSFVLFVNHRCVRFTTHGDFFENTNLSSILFTANEVPEPAWRSHCASRCKGISESVIFCRLIVLGPPYCFLFVIAQLENAKYFLIVLMLKIKIIKTSS